ncbi:MAG: NACHT domain-containing protein [Caldilineaceae bacterium]
MSDEKRSPNLSNRANHIDTNIGDGASHINVGQNITSVNATGDRSVAAQQIIDSIIITGDHSQVINQRLDPTDARNQRNHAIMRQLVRSFWIDGVLRHSLYNEILLRLNLEERPDAVDNRPWDLVLRQPGQPDNTLPVGTSIMDVFDRVNQLLLILGEPGSGKTTMLLELTIGLLRRAETDHTYPTPVLFNLSSWAEKKAPIKDWLSDELRTKYNIPKKVAKRWIEGDELLLLLDGLDEVQENYRHKCVDAINQFRQEHLVPLAVCSRLAEYEDLPLRLRLQGAVLLQPLTLSQMIEYIDSMGSNYSVYREIIKQDTEIQKLARLPLALNIMMLTYDEPTLSDFYSSNLLASPQQRLFDAYIKRMFVHREMTRLYSIRNTLHWLSWLAETMTNFSQTEFFIELLQPDWLQHTIHHRLYRLFVILMGTIICGLTFGLSYGLIAGLIAGPKNGLGFGIILGLISSPIVGLSIGLTIWGNPKIRMQEIPNFSWKSALITWMIIWKLGGWLFALIAGILFGLYELKSIRQLGESWKQILIVGLIGGLLVGINRGMMFGLIAGLQFGIVAGLIGDSRTSKTELRVKPNQGTWQSFKNGVKVGIIVCLILQPHLWR